MEPDTPTVSAFGHVMLHKQEPSLGRIVIYKPRSDQALQWKAEHGGNAHLEEVPAIVTCVHDEHAGYVNLRVFLDAGWTAWVTSVYPGDQPGTWHWPPRK